MGSDSTRVLGLGIDLPFLPEARFSLTAIHDQGGWRLKGVCALSPGGDLATVLKQLIGTAVISKPSLTVTQLGFEYSTPEDFWIVLSTAIGATGRPAELTAGVGRRNGLAGLKLSLGSLLDLSALPLIQQELKTTAPRVFVDTIELFVDSSQMEGPTIDQRAGPPTRRENSPRTPAVGRLPPADVLKAGGRLSAKLKVGDSVLELPPLRFGGAPAPKEGQANSDAVKTSPEQPVDATTPAPQEGYQVGPLYVKQVDLAFDAESSSVLFQLTGGVRLSNFQLTLIDAGVSVPLDDFANFKPFLGGLALSFKAGSVSATGAFLELGKGSRKYGGLLRVDLTKLSLLAMGLYEEITSSPNRTTTSLFIYGCLNAAGGAGVPLGPLKLTGLALAFGLNRRVTLPSIGQVADFPLVKVAMGQDAANAEPSQMLKQLEQYLPAEENQHFGCIGVRFTLGASIDCFALGIVQSGNELELALLGLARCKQENFCFLELALKILFRPSDGFLLTQGQLTGAAWVLDKSCRLTGGFAIACWFGGARKGDFVVTLGGYHPRFQKPEHYPVVPRLGLDWKVSSALSVKGELYCAITPSCLMAGGRLDMSYREGSISARFVAYADFLMAWAPLHYEVDVGVSIAIQVETWLFTVDVRLGVALSLWGPPFGGRAEVSLSIVSFTLEFEAARTSPRLIETWREFAARFVDRGTEERRSGSGKPVWELPAGMTSEAGPALFQLNLRKGALNRAPRTVREESNPADTARVSRSKSGWFVRGDELEFDASTAVPVIRLDFGRSGTQDGASHLPPSGDNRVVNEPLHLDGVKTKTRWSRAVGIKPMGVRSLNSTLQVSAIPENPNQEAPDVSQWKFDDEYAGMPGALWDTEPSTSFTRPQPEAKVIQDCLVGLTSLRPPCGTYHGSGIATGDLLTPRTTNTRTLPRLAAAPGSAQVTAASQEELARRREETAQALLALKFDVSDSR